MGRKIFISYKYADSDVASLGGFYTTTVRDYVDEIEQLLSDNDHIYKGEHDGEDLSRLSEQTIWSKLRDRIYDSSLTIVIISSGMREQGKPDRDQWIPWEISFSLKETSRHDSSGRAVTSKTNAMLAVVLPDRNDSYDYYLEDRACCPSGCVMHHTDKLFAILRKNKFNYIMADTRSCSNGSTVWWGATSYIEAVKWDRFAKNPEKYIDAAYSRRDDMSLYRICKTV